MYPSFAKLSFISGLRDVVLAELHKNPDFIMHHQIHDDIFLEVPKNLSSLLHLKSITQASLVRQDTRFNPRFINNHKSILLDLIDHVQDLHPAKTFTTFSISCAGSDSPEIGELIAHITTHYKLSYHDDADLAIHIGKIDTSVWEVGVRMSPRPLTIRDYRATHIVGSMNPTIAYAMNYYANLDQARTYLNVFSGGATLLIEAARIAPHLTLQGFDYDGRRNAQAITNIKQAGLIKKITLATADITTLPDFGMVDVITADLPFGQRIGKQEDLSKLYHAFITYCERFLNPQGTLVVYTTEHELLESLLASSRLSIHTKQGLKIISSENSYLYPKIFVATFH